MKINFVFIAFILILIIECFESKTESKAKSGKQNTQKSVGQKPNPNARKTPNTGPDIGGVAKEAVGLVTKKVKQVVVLIKCILKCTFLHLRPNVCSRYFPCLYDCFIGQEYIPPEVESELEKAGNSGIWPEGIQLSSIYTLLRCIYRCVTDRAIINWETFVYSIYCFADTCVCYNMFNAR